MKGIVLAGGTGTRLWPLTIATSKQLLPIHNKPLVYYPISVLMLAGIQEIMLVTTPEDQESFQKLLGDGSAFGVSITYAAQAKPEGIAQAFLIAENFISGDHVALILGDNLFYGTALEEELPKQLNHKGAKIFTYQVSNPVEYGVLNLDKNGNPLSVEEKPKNPLSDLAITGLYFFDSKVVQYAKELRPSARGELEITGIMQKYIDKNDLEFIKLPLGTAWLDTGTPNSLGDASLFVRVLEERTGRKIACLEEISYRNGWISERQVALRISLFGKSEYGRYLQKILNTDH
jgi:glucose-1-phosphate thymidylyltransferase